MLVTRVALVGKDCIGTDVKVQQGIPAEQSSAMLSHLHMMTLFPFGILYKDVFEYLSSYLPWQTWQFWFVFFKPNGLVFDPQCQVLHCVRGVMVFPRCGG